MGKRILFLMVIVVVGVGLAYGGRWFLAATDDGKVENGSGALTEAEILAARVEEKLAAMTEEELAGQMLIAGFSGYEPDYYIKRMIQLRHFGGVILFGRNVATAEQVGELAQALQAMAAEGETLPLWICVDEEGGMVRRMQGIVEAETDPEDLASRGDADYAQSLADAVGQELAALGVNVNFAPVVDIGYPGGIMVPRSLGEDPEQVGRLGSALIRGYQEAGVTATAKHFPGLGRATTDPHGEPVVIEASRAELAADLLPFREAIEAGVTMVMVSHALYPAYDETQIASMSREIQEGVLRQELGFDGIIVADDLEMGAALATGEAGEVAVAMIRSGADMLLLCHTPEVQAEAYDAVLAAVADGSLTRERLEDSVRRILLAKAAAGLW